MFFARIFSILLDNIGASLLMRHGGRELGLIDPKDKATARAADFILNVTSLAAVTRTVATTPLPALPLLRLPALA